MHTVAVLALDQVMPFEMSVPHRILGSARTRDGDSLYDVVTCSLDGAPVATTHDFAIAVQHGPEVLAAADTVIVPPFGSPDDPLTTQTLDAVDAALRGMKAGARLVSLCGAAYLLAAVGRLAGRPVTTHWAVGALVRRDFPDVIVDADVLFIDDGDLLTSAGSAAAIDLCLHLVREDHGAETANRVARWCVVPPHREGGQSQFIERPMPAATETSTQRVREWALQHLAEPLTLAVLAAQTHTSVRTLTRRFRDETGLSPHQWLLEERVDHARRLLETSDLPVEQVAAASGLGTAASLRMHFARRVGLAPLAYRSAFAA